MKIGVIGAGRLGICFALLCEQAGYDVLVSDVREDYVKIFVINSLVLMNQRFLNYFPLLLDYLLRIVIVKSLENVI